MKQKKGIWVTTLKEWARKDIKKGVCIDHWLDKLQRKHGLAIRDSKRER